jgi:hypothetical protein
MASFICCSSGAEDLTPWEMAHSCWRPPDLSGGGQPFVFFFFLVRFNITHQLLKILFLFSWQGSVLSQTHKRISDADIMSKPKKVKPAFIALLFR